MKVTMFGNKNTPESIKPILRETLVRLIEEGADDFYVGNHGSFDHHAASVLSELAALYPIRWAVVLAYLPRETADYPTIYPEGLERVPPRYAILRRNYWMIDACDVVIACMKYASHGTGRAIDYADKKHKRILFIEP